MVEVGDGIIEVDVDEYEEVDVPELESELLLKRVDEGAELELELERVDEGAEPELEGVETTVLLKIVDEPVAAVLELGSALELERLEVKLLLEIVDEGIAPIVELELKIDELEDSTLLERVEDGAEPELDTDTVLLPAFVNTELEGGRVLLPVRAIKLAADEETAA